MIFAVRLRRYNKKIGHGMRDYKSANGHRTYKVGELGQPSPIYIVDDKLELRELRQFHQFEIIPFDDRRELEDFVERETMTSARQGIQVAPPKIEEPNRGRKRAVPTVTEMFDHAPDGAGANSGRNVGDDGGDGEEGLAGDDDEEEGFGEDGLNDGGDELDKLRMEVSEMEAMVEESKSKGRTQRTIEKWEERAAEAKERLSKSEMDLGAE